MPIKNFLVALDGSPASDTALEAAVSMQKAYGAHMTAYVAVSDHLAFEKFGSAWIPPAIVKTINKATGDAIQTIEDRFAEMTRDLPADRVHLIERARGNDTTVAEASRFFDVTVVGIFEPRAGSSGLHPDRIALLSGRPVLAFPRGIDASRVAARAVVAWDGSRAAARAMNSAMRLLDTKETVTVVTVGEPPKVRVDASGLDPETALLRQGLSASWVHVPATRSDIAGTILKQAEALGAELLIMGAFEHSKFHEDIFGGVTLQVMADTKIPVFLAH